MTEPKEEEDFRWVWFGLLAIIVIHATAYCPWVIDLVKIKGR